MEKTKTMTIKRRKALLMLGELNNDDLDWMLRMGKKETIAPGQILIHEGQPSMAIYIVLDGEFNILLGNRPLAKIGTGELIGEVSFLDQQVPVATVQAATESVILSIPRWHLVLQLQKSIGFAARFYRGLALCLSDRMRGTIKRLGYGIDVAQLYEEHESFEETEVERLELAQAKFNWLLQYQE
ncbi:cyclic nucleotide-binding domain-containing protein [Spirulina subsalsa FACHB-351]|uniref:Cyclic nucleotide-binding domain-containing protein n=2 Tax=Spirulina subsalsa TaxID=54311 RepID=A0ABT3L703_9CYAN|nr:cyclic nucleotide-binding domain-containing protein [Spirulina subsalsa FACHB-351]